MGELTDRVTAMRIQVSTPDQGLTATLQGRDQVSLSLQAGLYRRAHEAGLERRLATLANLLWLARTREYRRILGDVTGDHSVGGSSSRRPADLAWRADLAALTSLGSSRDEHVTIRATGLQRWSVSIRPGTLRSLDEQQFTEAAAEAANALIRDQLRRVTELTTQHYR